MKDPHEPPVHTATFRFYAELNDFLPAGSRGRDFVYPFTGTPSIKDVIEAIGVPHPEIDLIVVDGVSVGFDHRLADGHAVSVYPVFEAFDISPVIRLRPEPLRATRFVLDVHLGRLARALRLLGFDSAWNRDATHEGIIETARGEHRIILTRDRNLLKSGEVTHGYWIRSSDPEAQLRDVFARFDLRSQAKPFARCSVCNGEIVRISTEEGRREAPPAVRDHCDEYHRCSGCGHLYWKGTHYARLAEFIDRTMQA